MSGHVVSLTRETRLWAQRETEEVGFLFCFRMLFYFRKQFRAAVT